MSTINADTTLFFYHLRLEGKEGELIDDVCAGDVDYEQSAL
jgi:hypothetical protein